MSPISSFANRASTASPDASESSGSPDRSSNPSGLPVISDSTPEVTKALATPSAPKKPSRLRRRVISSSDEEDFQLPTLAAAPCFPETPRTTKPRDSGPRDSGPNPIPFMLGFPFSPSKPSGKNQYFSETIGRMIQQRESKVPENWMEIGECDVSQPIVAFLDGPLGTKKEKKKTTKGPKGQMQMQKMVKSVRRMSVETKDLSARRVMADGSTVPLDYPKTKKLSFLEQAFLVLQLIGKGSFGEVFAAKGRENQKDYAIKVLTRKVVQSATNKFHEVIMLMTIPQHPNILGFEKAWEENERLHIQTELCTMTLLDLATQVIRIPEDKLWKILGDLASALLHLHSNDVIHADVKPENIFITEDFTMKLGDFGIAINLKAAMKDIEDGDSRYLSVEALNGAPVKASDIFALGVSMLEISSDMHIPSEGSGWHAIRDGQIPDRFFTGISKELRDVIKSMLQKDPMDRPTAKELLEQLDMRK